MKPYLSAIALTIASTASAREATLTAPDGTVLGPGVSVRIYDVGRSMSRLPLLVEGQTPNVSFIAPSLDLRDDRDDFKITDRFLTHVDAYLRVEKPGRYALRLISDDGSKLYVAGRAVIDHDGLHPAEPKDAEVELAAGLHAIEVWHFDNSHQASLALHWRPPGGAAFVPVPTANLFAPADEVRVTSPGPKRVSDPAGGALHEPGDGAPLDGVHPSYSFAALHRDDFQPRVGGIDFLPDGRLVICTWSPDGEVFLVDGVEHGDPAKLVVQPFASGLAEPLGLKVVDGRIFVLQKQELTELVDRDGDDVADEYRAVASGWPVTPNFHEFAFGLVYKDGKFYFNLATAINPGGASTNPQVYGRGTCVEVDAETGEFRYIAGGLRTPNGIGLGPNDEIFVLDNQGDWLPSSKMLHIREGRHYGNHIKPPGPFDELPETPPVVWLPQGEIGNSPSEPVLMKDGLYAGQMLHGDVTYGGLQRVYLDEVEGEFQGAVFKFTQGLTAGVNRVAWGPDGALYVGGIGSGGNWGQGGKLKYGLDRLEYTGELAFEMLTVRALSNGFEITMTEPFEEKYAPRPTSVEVTRFWYEPTAAYGGPKKDVTRVGVQSVTVSEDRRTLFVELPPPEVLPGKVYHLRLAGGPKSQGGRSLWSTETWYTLNRVPTDRVGVANPVEFADNALTDEERAQGWRLLFDGQTTDGWRGFGRQDMPEGWRVIEGELVRAGGGGDILTVQQFGDFELSLEWKVAEGGNSGIFYRGSEEESPIWRTAPEMQILDNARHGDGRNAKTSAGSFYGLIAPPADVTRPAGEWNEARVVARGGHIEHWLNGQKLLEIDIDGEAFQALVAASKFREFPNFAKHRRGHIALQDHGDRVAFRNIKIRELE